MIGLFACADRPDTEPSSSLWGDDSSGGSAAASAMDSETVECIDQIATWTPPDPLPAAVSVRRRSNGSVTWDSDVVQQSGETDIQFGCGDDVLVVWWPEP